VTELSVVTWLWRSSGARSPYGPEHVNALCAMVAKRYSGRFRFIVVTNERGPFREGIEVVPDAMDFAGVRSPEGLSMPSCYRRLRLFHPDARRWFGDRVASLDLDLVLTAAVDPLWDRPEDVVVYRDPLRSLQVNGSMLLLRTGSRPDVWNDFDPVSSPKLARAAGFRGSDQAWLSYCLGTAPRWDTADGVYSYRKHVQPDDGLPVGAKVVVFHGNPKPWNRGPQSLAWVRENWGRA